mmetsp:Transcript_22123/g.30482  ORF Transcript_22123/g.30482 Transcript_22123/m.30482 type:complete len:162 (-) Transcript_22123:41-526(-)
MITAKEKELCQRRIKLEAADLKKEPIPNVQVSVDKGANNLDWYCLINNLSDENFVGGEYILKIKLSPRYPLEPPDFYFLTPNGRFKVATKLCFSNSSFHAETWSPIWKLRTIILGFLSMFLENGTTGIGHLNGTPEEMKEFAANSKLYNQTNLKKVMDMFK